MARVPRATQQVQTAPLNPGFQSGRGASDAAFGSREAAADARTGQRISDLGDSLAVQANRIQGQENDRTVKDMDIRLSQAVRPLLYGDDQGGVGLFNMSGQQAVDESPNVTEAIEKAREEILASSPNGAVSNAWGLSSNIGLQAEYNRIASHTFGQRHQSQIDSTEAWILNSATDGIADAFDPLSREKARSSIRIGVEDLAELNGWTPEEQKEVWDTKRSQFHEAIVDRILTGGDPGTRVNDARTYFEEMKSDIAGDFYAQIEKKIHASANKSKATITREVNEAVDVIESDRDFADIDVLEAKVDELGDDGSELALRLTRAQQDRPLIAQFHTMTMTERKAVVTAGNENTSFDADQKRVHDKMVTSLGNDQREIALGNGMDVALKNKIIPSLNKIDFNDAESWKERAVTEAAASAGLGQTVSLLNKAETKALGEFLTSAPEDQVGSVLLAMQEGGGKDMTDRLSQDFADEFGGVAVAISLVGEAPQVAREILNGEQRMKENPNLISPKEEVNAVMAEVYDDLFDEHSDGETFAALRMAAVAHYAGILGPERDLAADFDASDFKKSLKAVDGGVLKNSNGSKVFAPVRDMTQRQFNTTRRNLDSYVMTNPSYASGNPVFGDGTPVPSDVMDNGGEFVSSGPGMVMVKIPGQGFVQNADGGAYEFDLGQAILDGVVSSNEDEGADAREYAIATGLIPSDEIGRSLSQGVSDIFGTPSAVPELPLATPGINTPIVGRTQAAPPVGDVPAAAEGISISAQGGVPVDPGKRPERPGASAKADADNRLFKTLIQREGYGFEPYDDLVSEGDLIVGFGHLVLPGEDFSKGLTRDQAKVVLRQDIVNATKDAKKFKWYKDLNLVRQNVVTHMIFNMGLNVFNKFVATQAAIAQGDWEEAAAQMLNNDDGSTTDWHDQVGIRARALAEQMRTGRF